MVRERRKSISCFGGAVALCAALGGCTTSREALDANDPLEPMNRVTWSINEKVDKYVELPIAGFYIFYVPTPLRRGADHVVSNLALPAVFANEILQGRETDAAQDFARFLVNSTLGIGGILDIASKTGLPQHRAAFGQTLALYGVDDGPFLVLPLIGPDPPRDLVGDAADLAANPLLYVPLRAPIWARATDVIVVGGIGPLENNARGIFLRQELEKDSLDPYATMRSVYRQLREEEIYGGLPPEETDPPVPKE